LSARSSTPRDADDALAERYDDVPYASSPDPARHPDRLATIGTLFGLEVPPVETARVLEVACGDGANLVSIAATLPNARCVGFDFAAQPIARAREMAGALALSNVDFLECDLRNLPDDLGTFDYILAHGFYSWVPTDVRAQLLPRIAMHLARNGVAFVSFNALPGSHLRALAWDMLAYHTSGIADRREQIAAARALLEIAGAPAERDDALMQALRAELRKTAQSSNSSLAHDDLAPFNHPVYFHAFAADAERAGLAFVADAHLSTMTDAGLAPAARKMLAGLDRTRREQYRDFLLFRHYRESLLCHTGAMSRFEIDASRALQLRAVPSLDTRRAAAARAAAPHPDADVAAITTVLVAHWPHSIPVAELARVCAEAAPPPGARSFKRTNEGPGNTSHPGDQI
jgi:2-polyprenyl-3-methyl-5-hydroxy-6-metoxy-1,4-benzoquinol methylase